MPWYKINKGDGIDNIYRDDQIEYGIDLTLKPTNNVNFSINSSIENRTGFMQWVDIIDSQNGKFEDSNGRYDIIYARTSSFNYEGNESFQIENQRGTFVFRWEFRPGSLIYLVYNLNDNNYFSDEDNEWDDERSNSLFMKLDYFLQP